MGTPWDAETYDRTSQPQQQWAGEVLSRVIGSRKTRPFSTWGVEPAA
ncbi:MAG TPA: hypothetical protein VNV44_11510 [Solirubrobacteraceae bacterium]|nr:hypothetical protein [Solirubrobacteraceae bacterium]